MQIARIWTAQRTLRRAWQIPGMVEALARGEELPRVVLIRTEDGEIQVQDGHHRLAAYWLSGRDRLGKHEYILLEGNQHRPRCGKIDQLV